MRTEGLKSVLPSALVATLIVTSMAFVISTTTVSAPSTISASPGATLSPTSARENTSIEFTVTVTNDYAADNIDNVVLIVSGFTQPTDLKPTTWNLSEITNGVRFDAIGDNVITPGSSETFVFLWTTPNIAGDYMISVLVSKEEVIYTAYENLGGFIVTIEGIKVLTPRAPIYINGNAGFTLENGMNGGGSGTENDPYIIENWDISAGSAIGIEIWNTTAHFIIRNCYVHDGVTYGAGIISLYWVTNGMLDNVLVENSYYQGILLSNSSNNTISNSTVENTQEQCGIFLYDSDNNLIENNTSRNNGISGIYLRTYSNNNIISNNIAENNSGIGIELYENSDNNTVSSNTCSNNYQSGIFLNNSSNNNIISNNTSSNNYYHGISLYDNSDNNLISNNIVEGNGWDGIALGYSGNNIIDNNNAESNSVGIFLNTSDNNLISNNILKNNTQGIFLYYSGDNNLISNNLAVRNGTGIYIQNYSDNNRIFHNNFVNNTTQAHDSCSNYWDNGYPSGGNYWNDYTGADNYQGENQDIPGSDGIGDTPYNIPAGSNQDRYPIMSPFPFRDVGVEISPVYREGPVKATLTYIVTVTNLGTENDNYDLTVSDDAGWGPTLSDNLLEVPAGENGQTTLSVTVPETAPPCIEDTMTVIVTSHADNRVKDPSSCKAHAISPKAEFSLVTLYEVRLDLNLYLENGSKLVVKFYTYEDAFENESVLENFAPPAHIVKFESVGHPENIAVKKVRLDLTTDNTENVISTLASFTVTRDFLFGRIMAIKGEWPIAPPDERDALFAEIMDIKGQWPIAPS